MKTLLILALLSLPLSAREIKLAWNPQADAAGFEMEIRQPDDTWKVIGETETNSITLTVPDEEVTFRVRAFRNLLTSAGEDGGRLTSIPSATLTLPRELDAPGGLRVEVQVTVVVKP